MTMYDFTGSRMTPDHIVFSLIRKPALIFDENSPLQSETMWEDFIACFYEMSWLPVAHMLEDMGYIEHFPGGFYLEAPLEEKQRLFDAIAPRWPHACHHSAQVSLHFFRGPLTSRPAVHCWAGLAVNPGTSFHDMHGHTEFSDDNDVTPGSA
jgi:hypothetical protein